MKSGQHYDVVIIGGGIAGLGCAVALAEAQQKVLVLHCSVQPGEATVASAGMLDPFLTAKPNHPLLDLSLRALRDYPKKIRKMESKTGLSTEFQNTGMVYFAKSKFEEKELNQRLKWQSHTSCPGRWLNQKTLLRRFPFLNSQVQSGVFYPKISRIDPQKMKQTLQHYARILGVRFQGLPRPLPVHFRQGERLNIQIGKKSYFSRQCVLAMGAWTEKMVSASIRVLTKPVRGQILMMKTSFPVKTIFHTLDGYYLSPWTKGHVILGSTLENAGFRPQVTAEGRERILAALSVWIPSLKTFPIVKSWAGLRPQSPKRLPVVGESKYPNVFFATGYYRSGILLGLLLGELLAKGMLSGRIPQELYPFKK